MYLNIVIKYLNLFKYLNIFYLQPVKHYMNKIITHVFGIFICYLFQKYLSYYPNCKFILKIKIII